jgi:type I restriction-modification system DNA methylase subunit
MSISNPIFIEHQNKKLKEALANFATWATKHIKGDERADAQTFLNHFFQAFGYEGVHEAGGRFEVSTEKASLNNNKGFFDCEFKGVAIFEMKGRGKNLNLYYEQLQKYWLRCIPKPRFAILCNFDEFWIYDFNISQMDEPIQKLKTTELALNIDKLAFMKKGDTTKINWQNNQVEITEKVASKIKIFYDDLETWFIKTNAFTKEQVQRFILQCMLCMFAEDIGLMERNLFTNLIEDCKNQPANTYDLLKGLFEQMNNPTNQGLGRFAKVPYFNGGLFTNPVAIPLKEHQLEALFQMAIEDWRPVRPSIFGTILEKMIENKDGSHYTHENDIFKIIRPTILQYWEERTNLLETYSTNKEKANYCKTLLDDLRNYKVLDPACGSGNFLYVAYQELKALEKKLIDLYKTLEPTPEHAYTVSEVSSKQFFGIDKQYFATELAKLALEIARKKVVDKFELDEKFLPLHNLEHNITCGDALFTPWHPADAIIGNPPFIGGKYIRKELGDAEAEKLYKAFKEVKGQVDYCAFWFRKAQEHLAPRCGLVATNSVAQGVTREASLKYIERMGGVIHNAVSTQPWSGEATVHVSLVNWVKQGIAVKQKMLDDQPVASINTTLKNEGDVTTAKRLKSNLKKSFEGCKLGGKGFIISESKAQEWIKKEAKNADVLKPMMDGSALADRHLALDFVIDFNDMPIEQASQYKLPFAHIKTTVRPVREISIEKILRDYWWRFNRVRPPLRIALNGLSQYFAVHKAAKHLVIQTVPITYLPTADLTVITSDDFYVFGVLNSKIHRQWATAQAGTLGVGLRYTNTTCFETFPFLWDAPEATKAKIRTIAQELDAYRLQAMQSQQIGITKLYNQFFEEPTSTLYKLHAQLDKAVCEEVYGWRYEANKNYNEALFELNQQLN